MLGSGCGTVGEYLGTHEISKEGSKILANCLSKTRQVSVVGNITRVVTLGISSSQFEFVHLQFYRNMVHLIVFKRTNKRKCSREYLIRKPCVRPHFASVIVPFWFLHQCDLKLLSYYKKMLKWGRVERGQYIISIENNDQNSKDLYCY